MTRESARSSVARDVLHASRMKRMTTRKGAFATAAVGLVLVASKSLPDGTKRNGTRVRELRLLSRRSGMVGSILLVIPVIVCGGLGAVVGYVYRYRVQLRRVLTIIAPILVLLLFERRDCTLEDLFLRVVGEPRGAAA